MLSQGDCSCIWYRTSERNWISEIKTSKDAFELQHILKEAWENTKGKERDTIKAEYDKRKVEINELGSNSQAQR
jgi:hypothetical protein